MKTKKTVIFMGYSCNNNCIFCCNSERRKFIKDKTTEEIKRDLISSRKQGSNYVELIGGEPTLRKDIFNIVSFAKKIGFKTIMFATNGRMFSNRRFTKKILDCGINHIVFSIHGHNPKLHDSLTNVPGSFKQLLKGTKNLKELGFNNIGSNTTIVKQNYKYILDIGKLIYNLGIRNSEFIFVDPTHGAPKNKFYELVPTYEEVSPYINRLLGFGKKKRIKHWHIRYYPLCFVDKNYHNMISEIYENRIFKTTHLAPDFTNKDVQKSRKDISRIKIAKCKICKYNKICEGYWKEYVNKYHLKQIRLELTYNCNRNCDFCYNKNKRMEKQDYFSLADFKKLIKIMKKQDIKAIRLTGGEPTIHSYFKKFLNLAYKNKFKITVNTNGGLFENFNKDLIGKIDNIIVPANSFSDFKKVKGYAKKVKKLFVNTVLTPKNISNLEKFYNKLSNVKNIKWNLLRYIPDSIEKELTSSQVKKLFIKLESFENKIYIDNLFPFCSYKPEIVKKYIRENGVCNGRNTIVVSPKGTFRTCNSISESLGNLKNNTPVQAWNSNFAKKIRNLKLLPKDCRDCIYLYSCNGGCRYMAKLKCRKYSSLDPLARPKMYLKN